MRIAIGADHAGFVLKEHLKQTLAKLGHSVDDHGTHSEESVDYPPICIGVGRAVAEGRAERGERLLEMFLQREASVIGANRDSHGRKLYCTLSTVGYQQSAIAERVAGSGR